MDDPVNAGTSATIAAPSITVTPSGSSGKTSTELEFESKSHRKGQKFRCSIYCLMSET